MPYETMVVALAISLAVNVVQLLDGMQRVRDMRSLHDKYKELFALNDENHARITLLGKRIESWGNPCEKS